MLRLAAISIAILTAIAAATLFSCAALAQEQDLPVAGPDEIIFVGEVPAPPGTEVTIEYLEVQGTGEDLKLGGFVLCATTQADENSRFVLAIDANCARSGLGPLICWGVDLCRIQLLEPGESPPIGGDTIDLARLEPQERADEVLQPPADLFGAPSLPSTGEGNTLDNKERVSWLLWAGAALLLAGVISGGASIVLRRRT